jgi:hypothetical protein
MQICACSSVTHKIVVTNVAFLMIYPFNVLVILHAFVFTLHLPL